MPEKKKSLWKRLLEWVGTGHSIHILLQTELVRAWLFPLGSAVLTGTSGVLGGIPLMWVLMASAVVFVTITLATVGIMALRIQSSPQNKLVYRTVFHCDLTPREAALIGNRQQRRAQGKQAHTILSSTQLDPCVSRTIDKE